MRTSLWRKGARGRMGRWWVAARCLLVGCGQQAEGLPCGSVPLGTADQTCIGHVTLGPQGSALRLLEGPTLEAGHPTCALHTWRELLGPGP